MENSSRSGFQVELETKYVAQACCSDILRLSQRLYTESIPKALSLSSKVLFKLHLKTGPTWCHTCHASDTDTMGGNLSLIVSDIEDHLILKRYLIQLLQGD